MLRLNILFLAGVFTIHSFTPLYSQAQEFNCNVSVNYLNLTGNDFSFLSELGQRIKEYINDRRWTEDRFEDYERIDCNMQIVLTEAITLTRFSGRIVIASRRPVYGTAQQTTVAQFNDDSWIFDYPRGTPLIFDPDRYHPITAVINFYAYLMLGYDYDTFSEMGGTGQFEKARRVAELAESSGSIGWSALQGESSRGELIAQIMDPRFRELRKVYKDYHLLSLDQFVANPDKARRTMLDVVGRLEVLTQDVSRSFYLDAFFTAKYKELAAVFQGSSVANQAYDTLTRIDPSHLSDYSRIIQ
ncbi:MAG: DUF4835 family protein [Rhodothermia bacterium]|nr:MAG: DUF4835 family protein [Rhodothermia bacterium]